MVGHPYDNGALILSGDLGATPTITGKEYIDWKNDDIYLALMDSTYVQDVAADVHWDDISAHDITEFETVGGDYITGGLPLTTVEPYIDGIGMTYNTYPPFRYLVYTANATPVAPNTIPYSIELDFVTFTDITGAVIYKKGATAATSPLFTFISELTTRTAIGDKYWIKFGNPGETLGLYADLLGT